MHFNPLVSIMKWNMEETINFESYFFRDITELKDISHIWYLGNTIWDLVASLAGLEESLFKVYPI